MSDEAILARLTPRTKAVFLTHCQGFNGLTDRLLDVLRERHIPLVEDVCESHGATFKARKLGSFGLLSNFSFYFAHHMSTIEGGMVCTDDENLYQRCRMWRSHGMTREMTDQDSRRQYIDENPELNADFIFALPGFNMRNTEIGAVIGRNQLKRLDENNAKRRENFVRFLKLLDGTKYVNDFNLEGSCNYAFNLVLRKPDGDLCQRVMEALRTNGIEFRRGSAGGGNQLRQPYLRGIVPADEYRRYPETDHIHFFGFYIGNYPDLAADRIAWLCSILNPL